MNVRVVGHFSSVKRNSVVFVLLFLVTLNQKALGQLVCSTVAPSKRTNANGNWNNPNVWTPAGVPGTYNAGTDTYTIPSGTVIEIAHNFDLSSNLIVQGTVLVTGKLVVTSTKTISIPTGGLVTCCESTYCGGGCDACQNSDQIDIGGYKWKGADDGSVSGPRTMSSAGLPITLVDFHASIREEAIALTWSTLMEKNFNYFAIERSTTGFDFAEIGRIKGNGNSNAGHDYTFIDENPLNGKSYYRLKSVDFDLYTEYFDVVAVDFNGKKKFSSYPNPSSGLFVEISTNFTPYETDKVVVLNGMGMEISRQSVQSNKTKVTFPNELAPGVYFLKYISSDFEKVSRFLVIH